jgi:hypothetical protein
MAVVAALLLMGFAFLNGYATFFNDSRSYVRGGAQVVRSLTHLNIATDWRSRSALGEPSALGGQTTHSPGGAYVTSNRSVYYGLLAALGDAAGNFWLTIGVQALSVALLAMLLARRVLGLRPLACLGPVALISAVSTVGPFVSYVMPDIFAGVAILGLTLLAFWDRLLRVDRVVVVALVVFAALVHPSHIALIGALSAAMFAGALTTRAAGTRLVRAGAIGLACAVAGFGGMQAFDLAVTKINGTPPLVLPHLSAHLTDMGPGTAYLKAHCGGAGPAPFTLCRFTDRLPQKWSDFMGGSPEGVFVVATPAERAQLSAEQTRFAIRVFAWDPLGVTAGLAHDAVSQLARFSLSDFVLTPAVTANFRTAFPPRVWSRIASSMVARQPRVLTLLSTLSLGSVLISFVGLGWVLHRTWKLERSRAADVGLSVALVVVGILANGLITGMLASPFDRFQARVIWLAPLVALFALAALRPRVGRATDEGGVVSPIAASADDDMHTHEGVA